MSDEHPYAQRLGDASLSSAPSAEWIAGAGQERAAVVAWLRTLNPDGVYPLNCADMIAKGWHNGEHPQQAHGWTAADGTAKLRRESAQAESIIAAPVVIPTSGPNASKAACGVCGGPSTHQLNTNYGVKGSVLNLVPCCANRACVVKLQPTAFLAAPAPVAALTEYQIVGACANYLGAGAGQHCERRAEAGRLAHLRLERMRSVARRRLAAARRRPGRGLQLHDALRD